MGIPTYFKKILKHHTGALVGASKPREINEFYMDYNGVVYKAKAILDKLLKEKISKKPITTASYEKKLIKKVIDYTANIVCNVVKPTQLFYIAFDGPAPRAKSAQQRSRRYKGIKSREYQSYLKKKHKITESNFTWDQSSNISPGTKFMEKLCNELLNAINKNIFSKHGKIKIVLSDSNVPGEGEHKIMPHIREKYKDKKTKIAIYSGDADLIVLSLASHKNNVSIIKEVNNINEDEVKAFPTEDFIYVDVDTLRKAFVKELTNDYSGEIDEIKILTDYTFLTFFSGNDFIQAMPFLKIKKHGLRNIMGYYKELLPKIGEHLIIYDINSKKDPEINMKFFNAIIGKISRSEDFLLKKSQAEYQKIRDGYISRTTQNKEAEMTPYQVELSRYDHMELCSPNHIYFEKYKDAFESINYEKPKHEWKAEYYKHFFGISQYNMKEYNSYRTNICKNYFQSLLFTLKYYLVGVPSWSWYYPFRVSPIPSDMYLVLKRFVKDINKLTFKLDTPYTPYQQLMLTLPPQSASLLPKRLGKLMTDPKYFLVQYYPVDFELEALSGIKNIYSEAILPEFDDKLFLSIVMKMESKLGAADKKRNLVRNKPFIIE